MDWPNNRAVSGVMLVLLVSLQAATAAAGDLDGSLATLHKQAETAAAEKDWLRIEQLRLERGRLLEAATEDSPWVAAHKALQEVNGSPATGTPGLVDRLEYKQACQRLLEAWKPFQEQETGPVYGDVAVRLFQVGQQALAVHRDALTEGGINQVASMPQIRAAIERAALRDPCQQEARAIQLYLEPFDHSDTFLRLEERPALRERNAALLGMSWPKQGPVLPHHAPVEYMKALLMQNLINEQHYGDFLEPEGMNADGSVRSGLVLKGVDGRSSPFRVVYGRYLLMEVADETGRPTPAFVFLNAEGEWDKRYLRLIYRKPDDTEAKQPQAAFFAEFFSTLKPTATWKLGPHEYGLYDLPIDRTEQLVRRDVKKISVRKAAALARGKSSLTGSEPEVLLNQLEKDSFPSHPSVVARIEAFAGKKDRTNHALVDLMGLRAGETVAPFNPLIVMSADDRARPELTFARESTSGDAYLELDDGHRLAFRDDTKEFVVKFPGVDGHLPLTVDAIPDSLLLQTAAGRLLESMFVDAGYSEEQSIGEIRKMLKNPRYLPPKFESVLKAKQKSRRQAGGGAMALGQIAQEILRDKGWSAGRGPVEELEALYAIYGFRYLDDDRGMIVTNPALLAPDAARASPPPGGMPRMAFRRKDGRAAIDESQVYTAGDYEKMRQNMATEFLPAMAALQPCLQAMDWTQYGLRGSIKDPAAVAVPDAAFAGWSQPGGGEDVTRFNRLFAEYARAMLASSGNQKQRERLLAIQLESARRAAKTGHFHRAIVSYNELVRLVAARDGEEISRFRFDLFGRVPTPADLATFAEELRKVLEGQKRLIQVQAEQAAVLRAAGLADSASFLYRQLEDQFRYYTLPLIDLSEQYAKSYAFAGSAELERARTDISGYLTLVATASAGLRKEGEYRSAALAQRRDDEKAAAKLKQVEDKASALAAEKEGEERAKQVKAVEADVRSLAALRPSLEPWARIKVAARKSAQRALYRSSFVINPVQVAPAAYDPERGFSRDIDVLFSDDLPTRLAAWAQLSQAEAAKDPLAGEYNFLVGWFWLERRHADFAWTAFIEASKAFAARGKGDDLPGLVARRNAMMMLVAAASVVQAPAGIDAVKTDFVDGLRGQALLWERTWVSKLHNGGHASNQRELIDDFLNVVRTAIHEEAERSNGRYFFPDVTFQHGALPDLLVADAARLKLFESVVRNPDDTPRDVKLEDLSEEDRKKPENMPRELGFEAFMERLYRFPENIDPEIVQLSTR